MFTLASEIYGLSAEPSCAEIELCSVRHVVYEPHMDFFFLVSFMVVHIHRFEHLDPGNRLSWELSASLKEEQQLYVSL